jgi:hypothetical protein
MTTPQRVQTALRRQQPDRVPVFTFLNPYVATWQGDDPSYAEVLAACREYGDTVDDFYFPSGPIYSAAVPARQSRPLPDGQLEHTLLTPAGPLTSVTRADWRGGGTVKRWITQPEDVERLLSIPYEPIRPDLSEVQATRLRLAEQAIGQVTFNDPICIAGLVDEMTMAIWTREQRPLLRRVLDVACERLLEELRYCLEAGLGPLYYFNGPEYALPPLMSPADFEEFVVAYDTQLVRLIHQYPGNQVIIHSHGRVNRFLERFAAMGTDGLNVLEPPPLGDTELAAAKARIGDRVCLIGNIQYDDLARGTPDQVDELVRQALAAGGPGGGFILCPCAAPYERPLPPQAAANLIRYLEAARRWGSY